MRRWIVEAGVSSPAHLKLEDIARPEPGPGEVRVKLHAVSLNRRDELLLSGAYQAVEQAFVPLSDGAGEVDAIGPGVVGWSLGDRVIGNYFAAWQDGPPAPGQGWGLGSPGQDGMLTEYAILKADRITSVPASLTYENAACLPCATLTAWTGLNGDRPYRRPLTKGETVLVTGTGSVSLAALMLAKAAGAQVIATTSDDRKVKQLKALGVTEVINYKVEPNWGQEAFDRFGGVDRVINSAGSGVLDQAIAAAAPGGEIALMGLYDFAQAAPDLIPLMAKGLSIRGTAVGSSMALTDLVRYVEEHAITLPMAARFDFLKAKEAYEMASMGKAFGKVIISIAS